MKQIPHDGSVLLWPALLLAASAFSAGCSTSHESSGGDGGGAPSSCPATYADVPQGSACSGDVSCDYYGQYNCQCGWYGQTRAWLCTQFNCICLPPDAACGTFCPNDASPSCINQPCNTDADCPSGQHCGQEIGPGGGAGKVCSFGCEGDAGPGGPNASCPFGGTCEPIAP